MNRKSRLLVIDDEQIVLDSCTQILAGNDVQVATASNGTRGLELVKEWCPDLVLVDLKMPGISGLETLQQIRDLDPTTVAVVITGYATVSSAVEAMKNGAYDFLPKPFTPDELRMITRRGLEKRQLVLETMVLRREKDLLREQFAAIVSHELKSPLSAVQQNLFALADDLSERLTDEERQRFERIEARISDLNGLIHSWLRVISADVNKLRETFAPISLTTVIARALENIQPQAARKDIELKAPVKESLPLVDGDEGALGEAFTNVIGNAVKYSRAGSPVDVRVETSGREIVVSVIDTGVGIAKEDLPFVFDDFYVGTSRPQGEQSTGLGLAITRRIIEAHYGRIAVESELGKGSTFRIWLPFAKQ